MGFGSNHSTPPHPTQRVMSHLPLVLLRLSVVDASGIQRRFLAAQYDLREAVGGPLLGVLLSFFGGPFLLHSGKLQGVKSTCVKMHGSHYEKQTKGSKLDAANIQWLVGTELFTGLFGGRDVEGE